MPTTLTSLTHKSWTLVTGFFRFQYAPVIACPAAGSLLGYQAVAVAAILVAITAAVWLWFRPERRRTLPPGPRGFPLIGFLPFLGRNHHVMFRDLAKIYGPVVRIRIGTANIVALNSYESIKRGLSNNAVQARYRSVFLEQTKSPGTPQTSGPSSSDLSRRSSLTAASMLTSGDSVFNRS
ncbi:unnamed protein product, partial [Ixodes persulcatus]